MTFDPAQAARELEAEGKTCAYCRPEKACFVHAIVLAERAYAAGQADGGPWRQAIIDAAVVSWVYRKEHDTNPRAAINDLLAWTTQVALDPVVSEGAVKLRADGAAAERARCAAMVQDAIYPSCEACVADDGTLRWCENYSCHTLRGIVSALREPPRESIPHCIPHCTVCHTNHTADYSCGGTQTPCTRTGCPP